jgi:hypothetical protein
VSATLPPGYWRHADQARFGRRRLLLEQLLAEFAAEGPVAIARARAMRTTTYLKLCACLLGPADEADEDAA